MVHKIILKYFRLKLHEIAETIGTSKEPLNYTLCEILDTKKLSPCWEQLLTDQKITHLPIAKQSLVMFKLNLTEILSRFITENKAWIQH